MKVWGITDGSAGMVAQVRALALALGVEPEMKKIVLKKPWAALPNVAAAPLKRLIVPYALDTSGDTLSPPWVELAISCGRKAAMAAMGLKARVPGIKVIHIQDPQVSAKHFDLVVAMEHDKITGPNVIKTRFALHAITPPVLEQAKAHFASRFTDYPAPRVAVLLGGSTNKYTLTAEAMAQLVMALQRLAGATQGSLLITPSRRTGAENVAMLRNVFLEPLPNPPPQAGKGTRNSLSPKEGVLGRGANHVYIYDGVEENPYMGMLALADAIVVTNDSVNMMSEAYATGKPLYILKLPGHEGTKPARFAEALLHEGSARLLGNKIESWSYPVNNEMQWLAGDIKKRLALT